MVDRWQMLVVDRQMTGRWEGRQQMLVDDDGKGRKTMVDKGQMVDVIR